MPESQRISANLVAALLGEPIPSEQQAAVIEAPPGPQLVVAGAGAGKTKTMALRVVWLVANGYAHPDQVLGLTFTRKAAQQLSRKIRDGLAQLAGSPKLKDVDPTGKLARFLQNTAPTAVTYDSFVSALLGEYGLLIPVEPGLRIAPAAEQYLIAQRVLMDYSGELTGTTHIPTAVSNLLKLDEELDNQLATMASVRREANDFNRRAQEFCGGKENIKGDVLKWVRAQNRRVQLLTLVQQLREAYRRRGVTTFHRQMNQIAALAERNASLGESQRRRYRIVMLDEYQDTSLAQRNLLRSLFGNGVDPELTVNAVGDPMQAIYSWRGATSANLEAFTADFPVAAGEAAPKAELTISFRNPKRVLSMANAVSEEVLGPPGSPSRAVSPLEAFGETEGGVELCWLPSEQEERRHIAQAMAKHYREDKKRGEKFTAAVISRTNGAIPAIYAELVAHGVPAEIVNTTGLLEVPEVADLVAVATMLVRPDDNQAAVRVLTSPMVGLSAADLRALKRRASELSVEHAGHTRSEGASIDSRMGEVGADDPAYRKLIEQIEQVLPQGEELAGLSDAIADPGDAAGFSEVGFERVRRLGATLRALRTGSLRKPLPELFSDIERAMGIRTEVLSRQDPYADGAPGVVQLDRFFEEVAGFAAVPGADLSGFLDYLNAALGEDHGLRSGEVAVHDDRVQVLTAHKAKGLEWRHVAVAHVTESSWEGKKETFVTRAHKLPPEACEGNAQAEEFVAKKAHDRKEFVKLANEYQDEQKQHQTEESWRLFYVAVTRAEETLMISGSSVKGNAKNPVQPFEPFVQLKERFPGFVTVWNTDAETDAAKAEAVPTSEPNPDDDVLRFPTLSPRPSAQEAAAEINEVGATGELPAAGEDELSQQWEADATALIEEHRALSEPTVDVTLAGRLTASDLVNLNRDPVTFARRARRPVPFKPNAYAKRGTAFHAWLEERFGGQSFLDEDELPGLEDDAPGTHELAELKDLFLASPWADRTPRYVELPFEVLIGDRVVSGRMDAVFADPETGGWMIVDWKTGAPPKGVEREQASYQLAVYREAFTQLLSARNAKPVPVRAMFYYVAAQEGYEPEKLPSYHDLAALVELNQAGAAAAPGRTAGEARETN